MSNLSDEELLEKYRSDKVDEFGGILLESNGSKYDALFVPEPYEEQSVMMGYLPLATLIIIFVVGFILLRKFVSSVRNFATPLKWLILVAWNLTLAVVIYESQRGTHLSPAMFWTSISIILSYGYLFGFKKK